MRGFAVILAVAATASWTAALAQTTPNVVTPTPGLSTPLTFTTTNCMMSCNIPGRRIVKPVASFPRRRSTLPGQPQT